MLTDGTVERVNWLTVKIFKLDEAQQFLRSWLRFPSSFKIPLYNSGGQETHHAFFAKDTSASRMLLISTTEGVEHSDDTDLVKKRQIRSTYLQILSSVEAPDEFAF